MSIIADAGVSDPEKFDLSILLYGIIVAVIILLAILIVLCIYCYILDLRRKKASASKNVQLQYEKQSCAN